MFNNLVILTNNSMKLEFDKNQYESIAQNAKYDHLG